MSLICLKLIYVPCHLRIKSKIILMVSEALCDLTPARLSHFMSYCSPLPCSNLSTLALLHLIMIYPHCLFCFLHTGPPCTDMQVVHCVTPGEAFSRLQGERCPWKCANGRSIASLWSWEAGHGTPQGQKATWLRNAWEEREAHKPTWCVTIKPRVGQLKCIRGRKNHDNFGNQSYSWAESHKDSVYNLA